MPVFKVMNESSISLFLVVPPDLEFKRAQACLQAACYAADVAAVLVPAEAEREVPSAVLVRTVIETVQPMGVAVLVENAVSLVRELGADGVHVTRGPREVERVRRLLGREAIVGAICEKGRHEAMLLGEAGIDYLAIDQRREAAGENLLAWWAEMFVIPVVAFAPVASDEVPELVRLRPDFIRPDDAMWHSPEVAKDCVLRLMHALKEASS